MFRNLSNSITKVIVVSTKNSHLVADTVCDTPYSTADFYAFCSALISFLRTKYARCTITVQIFFH